MEKTMIRERLLQLSEGEYKKFNSKLLPGIENILGVRMPLLKNLAKEIVKDDWRNYLSMADNYYFEEILLQGLVIGYSKADIEEILRYIADFVPKINNWAICDSFCAGLKITKKNMSQMWNFLQVYVTSSKEFDIRFAVVMLLDFYIVDDYIGDVLSLLDKINHEGYYVKMAVAWTLSVCFVKYPEKTMIYLKESNLDTFTYNKALQKITESFRVEKDVKEVIRSMKRK